MTNDNISLETELAKRIIFHKNQIITLALIDFYDKGIYNSKLLKDYDFVYYDNNYKALNEMDIAFLVVQDLEDRLQKGETAYYNKVYEACWKKERKILDEFGETPCSKEISDYIDI